ncbi:DNA helicase INO80 [Abeliophyllum distichum]|uniref:Chromatin-remodeling ATPase INO80 n=1 Tax=Abeliophyllum distichum TaxID=126358 RepID=A0ABD1PTW9_9LAMI
MDSKRKYSYTNLFNLEPLMNFQLPKQDDDFDYYENSSQDESKGSQGGAVGKCNNGIMSERGLKKKRRSFNSSDEDEARSYSPHITEERYRAMLGEHIQKYKRRLNNSSQSPASARTGTPATKSSLGSKDQKLANDHRGLHKLESTPDFLNNANSQKLGNYHESEFGLQYGAVRPNYEPALLDIGDGITYRIPPPFEKFATSLSLPSMSDIRVEEFYLKGTLDLGSLAAMMASDRRFGQRNRAGMGDLKPQYESLQEKLKAQSVNNSAEKFSLKISEAALQSNGIPEGAAGRIQRSILSEGGVLQVYYVKVLEKGDTYEIIERSLPKKPKVKKDPSTIEREEMEKIGKYWVNIVRKDIPKHHRIFTNFHKKQLTDAKRFSELCQRDVKVKVSRSLKLMRGAAIRTRKLARDMLVFWKRVDKEMAEVRKREEKEAAEALKREQELREAKRQQQRLNFLLSQTELYSHFMQNKTTTQTSEALTAGDENSNKEMLLSSSEAPLEEDDDLEDAELRKEALKAAQDAVSKQKMMTSAFDSECLKLRQALETDASLQDVSVAESSKIDLLHPSTMPVASTVQTPELFNGSLKEYQLKGLQWLVNCYEQGLNGILADEMGLGKTIQAMAFLAHLAEEKNIWGPFLVVAPASVLNNWADEISRFCPDLKTLPYWGGLQERTVLRKNINPKRLYRRDAGFHILITSYQLLVSDEKYFRRVKWQYMVLDEAQAIKSSNSIRWKTLLSFNCRNRLLLTGTPVQNNMAELWALLHFIMPTLFDSHEQFNEWFSKGIESHAEHGGTLNEHQLNRLHAILKPFMLRRVKKDVITELTGKTEITVHCKLSSRQQAFYQAIKNKISLAELFDGNRGHLNEKKILNLMNIVIQLRKVCNHPELFERNEGSTYFYFGEIPNSLLPPPFGELEDVHYSGGRNPITYEIPKLVYQEVGQGSKMRHSATGQGISSASLQKYFNIFSAENVYHSIFQQDCIWDGTLVQSGTFGFSRMIDLSPVEVSFLATGSLMERLLFSVTKSERQYLDGMLDLLTENEDDDIHFAHIGKEKVRAVTRMLLSPSKSDPILLTRTLSTGFGGSPFEALVMPHDDRLLSNVNLLHSVYSFIPRARAPPDSGKLQTLDILLKRLRAENHRVLLFAQMTKMLNILEDYMNYRKYRYLRLDGSSTIMDRRDMVRDFQHRQWDRAHRLGQTKDVSVYRLICKETVEEKILQRASQKNTVQQLVMTGGHVQGDLLAPEDVVSLLIDDTQLEHKLKEVSQQAKDRQKKKGGTKGIRIDAEGGASLEDLTNPELQGTESEPTDADKAKSNDKKRKTASDKHTQPKPRAQKNSKSVESLSPSTLPMDYELDDLPQDMDTPHQRPKRLKRPTKSVNENIEPAFMATSITVQDHNDNLPGTEFGGLGT